MIFSLAIRNALRNRRRSLLTAATVTLGTALLTVAMSWVQGVMGGALDMAANQIGFVRVVDPDYAQREQILPLSENIPATDALVAAVAKVPGVTSAFPRIQMGVTLARADQEIGEQFGLVVGAPLAYFTGPLELERRVASGELLAADDEVVVGKTLADDLGAKVGDELILLGQTQDGSLSPVKLALVGVVDLGNAQQNRQIFVTLEKARWMADIPEGATEVVAFGADRRDAAEMAAAVAALPEARGLETRSWDQRRPFDEMLGLMRTFQGIAAGIIVFITALGVLNTMLMSVLERTAEIGVLRALGLRRRQVIVLFVVEAMAIALVGGLLGVALGSLGGLYSEHYGVNLGSAADKLPPTIPIATTMYGDLTPDILATGLALGLAMAVIGSVLPAFRASRIEPVEAMRHRR